MTKPNETKALAEGLVKVEDWSAKTSTAFVHHVNQAHDGQTPDECQTCYDLVVAGEQSANRIRAGRNELFARRSGLM